jgi:type I restriction enzyme S subunit
MSEWPQIAIRDIATHIKDGTHGTHRRMETGIPLLSAKNISQGGRLTWDRTDDLISAIDYALLTSTFAPKPKDLLLTVVGSIGRSALFEGGEIAFQRSVAFVRCNGLITPEFLYQASCAVEFTRQLERRCNVTAQAGLYLGELAKIKVPLPPKVQQEKIATILSTIDTAIEQTEALIEKYQHIKAGLMHDLFTRGVLPNGQLRPPREQAPELYQETAIGWVPREWRLMRCVDICSRICVGIVIQPTQYYVDAGVPALRSANVREDGIDPSNFVYIAEKSNQILSKSQLRAGDIVSVRTGYPGTSAVVPLEFQGANCIDILISTPSAIVDSDYLCFWINSSFGKEQVLRQQGGMAQQHFNVGEMRELLVALPALAEQAAICEKLQLVSRRLDIERARRGKMQLQKLGLMQDLLTGKVPVAVDASPSEAAA